MEALKEPMNGSISASQKSLAECCVLSTRLTCKGISWAPTVLEHRGKILQSSDHGRICVHVETDTFFFCLGNFRSLRLPGVVLNGTNISK